MNDSATPDSRSRHGVWSRYWSSGALHSCPTSYAGNYEGPVADFWHRCFDALTAGAYVLDIATGNGPLPQLLFARAGTRGIACEAIDQADVTPGWPAQLPAALRDRLRFRSGVNVEALPFAAQTFDLVASHYGLGYGNLDLSLPGWARVLRAGGMLFCVLHHAQALTVRLAGEELRHIDWIVEHGGFLDLGLAMVEPVSRAGTAQGRAALAQDPAMNELRGRFNAAQDEAQARVAASSCPDVIHETRRVVAAALDEAAKGRPAPVCERIETYRRALGDTALRLSELRACALDEDGVAQLCSRLSTVGILSDTMPLSDKHGLYGWSLQGKKRGP